MENIHLTENTKSDKSSRHVNTAFIFFERWKSLSSISFITGVCFVESITFWLAVFPRPGAVMRKQQITCVSVTAAGSRRCVCWCQRYSDVRLGFRSEHCWLSSTWLLLSTSREEFPELAAGPGTAAVFAGLYVLFITYLWVVLFDFRSRCLLSACRLNCR